MKKRYALFLLFALLISACGQMNPPSLPAAEAPVSSGEETAAADGESPAAEAPLFDAVIANAIEACRGAGLNQACHNGEVSDLADGQTFRAESAALDSYDIWAFRLQAPGVDSDFESLLILAAGNAELRFDEIFIGRDETNQNLPRLTFSSAHGADFSSGLVIINESAEDLLSLEVNGVGLTLGSTAVATSQPNGEMKVRMLTGTVAATTSETVHAAAGETVRVPMSAESKPQPAAEYDGVEISPLSDNPQPAAEYDGVEISPLDDDPEITPLVSPSVTNSDEDEITITPLTGSKIETTPEYFLRKFKRAYNRCMDGDARQVYNVMYFAQYLLNESRPYIRKTLGDAALQAVREQVKQCATFELILTGSQQGSSSLSWTSKVSGDVVKLQFDYNGKLAAPAQGDLTVTEFSPEMPLPPGCVQSAQTDGGLLHVQEISTLKIHYNTMRLRLYIWPDPVIENLILNCPSAAPVQIPLDWNTYFWYLHPDLLRRQNQSYLIQNWEYTGGQIYAEAFYLNRSGTIEDGTVTSDTAFTLMHTPQK